jgi:hypothetical protein
MFVVKHHLNSKVENDMFLIKNGVKHFNCVLRQTIFSGINAANGKNR